MQVDNQMAPLTAVKAPTVRQALAARQPVEVEPSGGGPTFVTGYDNVLALGRLALGPSQIDSWKSKGLEVTNKTLEAAYDTFNQAFKASADSPHSGSIAFNAHKIMTDHQPVPEWFMEEHRQILGSTEIPGVKAAFYRGEYFHISAIDNTSSRALKAYSETQMAS